MCTPPALRVLFRSLEDLHKKSYSKDGQQTSIRFVLIIQLHNKYLGHLKTRANFKNKFSAKWFIIKLINSSINIKLVCCVNN